MLALRHGVVVGKYGDNRIPVVNLTMGKLSYRARKKASQQGDRAWKLPGYIITCDVAFFRQLRNNPPAPDTTHPTVLVGGEVEILVADKERKRWVLSGERKRGFSLPGHPPTWGRDASDVPWEFRTRLTDDPDDLIGMMESALLRLQTWMRKRVSREAVLAYSPKEYYDYYSPTCYYDCWATGIHIHVDAFWDYTGAYRFLSHVLQAAVFNYNDEFRADSSYSTSPPRIGLGVEYRVFPTRMLFIDPEALVRVVQWIQRFHEWLVKTEETNDLLLVFDEFGYQFHKRCVMGEFYARVLDLFWDGWSEEWREIYERACEKGKRYFTFVFPRELPKKLGELTEALKDKIGG